MRSRILAVAGLLISIVVVSRAGGPAFIAGSGYDPGVEGHPLIWANASVQYFTDQGDLSPILPNAQADAFVATAFITWTSISSVALTVSQSGHLAEDVNGGNIAADANGTITAPADITSAATASPLGIVYDYDGTVTDARSARAREAWPIASPTPCMGGPTTSSRPGTSFTRSS